MKMRKIALLLLAVVSVSIVFGQTRQKVAVYVTGAEEGVNEFVGTYLVNSIVSSNNYVAGERSAEFANELSKMPEYQLNDDQISLLGRRFGVQLVCVAKIGQVSTQQFISARLIDVETAMVTKSTKPILFTIDNIDESCAVVTADLFNSEQFLNNFEAAKTNEVKEPAKQEPPKTVYKTTDSEVPLYYTYSGAKVYQNGRKLSANEVRSRLANSAELDLYNKGRRYRSSGAWAMSCGITFVAGGLVFISYGSKKSDIIFGTATIIFGSAFTILGGATRASGTKLVQKSINQYNDRASSYSSLQFGVTSNGLGFTYNF